MSELLSLELNPYFGRDNAYSAFQIGRLASISALSVFPGGRSV